MSEVRGNLHKVVDNTMPDYGARKPSGVGKESNREKIASFVITPLRGLRWALYYVLMWIRPLMQFVMRLIAIPTLAFGLIAFGIRDEARPHLPWLLLGLSLSAFLIGWFYDSLILAVAPEPIQLM